MRTSRPIVVSIVLLACSVLPPVSLADEPRQADLPRYQLTVGRRLTWTWSSETTEKTKDEGEKVSRNGALTELTVLRDNPDGSRRVLVRHLPLPGAKEASEMMDDKRFAYADVFPDGRVAPSETADPLSDVVATLPLLPADAEKLASGWTDSRPERQEERTYAPRPADKPGELVFAEAFDGLLKRMYTVERSATYRFDRARGVITAVESRFSQTRSFDLAGTTTTTLTSDDTLPPDAAAALAADVDLFAEAKRAYRRAMTELADAPADRHDALAAAAHESLARARGRAKGDVVGAEFDHLLKAHADYAKHVRERADEAGKLVDKPSPDWETTDLDGKPVKLADFRGKVLVMDFWYRGCGYCMYAMPQVKQLSADFKGRPVVFVSMNTDVNEEDARFVVDYYKLDYPTIKARGINDKYDIHSFPTMLIIDPHGVVRHVHVGYSKTLHADMTKKINAVLAASPR